MIEGRSGFESEDHIRAATTEHGATTLARFGNRRTLFWTATDAGVAMTATHAHADRAISLFDPPLLIGPLTLRAGEAIEVESRMTVVDENDMTRVRHRGRATRSIVWTADTTIRLDGVVRRAHVIEAHFKADLGLAKATEHATLLFVPEVGFVHEDRVESVRALGLFSRRSEEVLLRSFDAP